MEIILLTDVKNIGQRGEIKNVSPGFARNFLIPKKLAALATQSLKEQWQKEKIQKQKEAREKEVEKQDLIATLKDLKISFREKASEEGTLFSGLTKEKIAQKIKEEKGQLINQDSILLDKPIKQLGEYSVNLRISNKDYPITIEVKK